jgi:uncharacterized protein YyaL (SSP411 family)
MPNALAAEASPYLQQHADNPVDWYPWGEEALSLARERDVPILLSIGYSSCHWCHVMAHESFEDVGTAEYMNENFVNIKVDREERPDIDAIYMEAAQAISGHGGWPLTAFLTTEQVPFFAGTYFPPEPRPSMPSFKQIMRSIREAWDTQRTEIEDQSERMINALGATTRMEAPADPIESETIESAVRILTGAYDQRFGGFGGAPKFPAAGVLDFLLGRQVPAEQELALETLRKMAAGGIHDQIGGGFARYSVDERWHIPHFEKMLYDNAQLVRAYVHAFQVTGDEAFSAVARDTIGWILTDLLGNEGGFASSLDADSPDADGHVEEGAFYAWDIDELREIVESAAPGHIGDIFLYWGVIDHGEFEGKNVLFVNAPERRPDDEVLEQVRRAILQRRNDRPPPARDEKRLTAWNALTIAALAEAGAVMDEPTWSAAAVACAEFIERELVTADGRLLRSWNGGVPGPPAYLEDHADLINAYLTLYEFGGDERWFTRAREIAELTLDRFEDAERGGFFSVADDHESLIVRRKDIEDSPVPSGNSAIALALLRLHAFTGEQRYRDSATRALQLLQRVAARFATGFGNALQAIDFYLGPTREIAIVGADDARSHLRRALYADYRPRTVVAERESADDSAVALLEGRGGGENALAYVCENFACELPVSAPEQLLELLG